MKTAVLMTALATALSTMGVSNAFSWPSFASKLSTAAESGDHTFPLEYNAELIGVIGEPDNSCIGIFDDAFMSSFKTAFDGENELVENFVVAPVEPEVTNLGAGTAGRRGYNGYGSYVCRQCAPDQAFSAHFNIHDTHRDFEVLLAQTLRSSSCAAYANLEDVVVTWSGDHALEVKEVDSVSTTGVPFEYDTKIKGVEGEDLDGNCIAAFVASFISAYNDAYESEDDDVEDVTVESVQRVGLSLRTGTAGKYEYNLYGNGVCRRCSPGLTFADQIHLQDKHQDFEIKLKGALESSGCAAFVDLDDKPKVKITVKKTLEVKEVDSLSTTGVPFEYDTKIKGVEGEDLDGNCIAAFVASFISAYNDAYESEDDDVEDVTVESVQRVGLSLRTGTAGKYEYNLYGNGVCRRCSPGLTFADQIHLQDKHQDFEIKLKGALESSGCAAFVDLDDKPKVKITVKKTLEVKEVDSLSTTGVPFEYDTKIKGVEGEDLDGNCIAAFVASFISAYNDAYESEDDDVEDVTVESVQRVGLSLRTGTAGKYEYNLYGNGVCRRCSPGLTFADQIHLQDKHQDFEIKLKGALESSGCAAFVDLDDKPKVKITVKKALEVKEVDSVSTTGVPFEYDTKIKGVEGEDLDGNCIAAFVASFISAYNDAYESEDDDVEDVTVESVQRVGLSLRTGTAGKYEYNLYGNGVCRRCSPGLTFADQIHLQDKHQDFEIKLKGALESSGCAAFVDLDDKPKVKITVKKTLEVKEVDSLSTTGVPFEYDTKIKGVEGEDLDGNCIAAFVASFISAYNDAYESEDDDVEDVTVESVQRVGLSLRTGTAGKYEYNLYGNGVCRRCSPGLTFADQIHLQDKHQDFEIKLKGALESSGCAAFVDLDDKPKVKITVKKTLEVKEVDSVSTTGVPFEYDTKIKGVEGEDLDGNCIAAFVASFISAYNDAYESEDDDVEDVTVESVQRVGLSLRTGTAGKYEYNLYGNGVCRRCSPGLTFADQIHLQDKHQDFEIKLKGALESSGCAAFVDLDDKPKVKITVKKTLEVKEVDSLSTTGVPFEYDTKIKGVEGEDLDGNCIAAFVASFISAYNDAYESEDDDVEDVTVESVQRVGLSLRTGTAGKYEYNLYGNGVCRRCSPGLTFADQIHLQDKHQDFEIKLKGALESSTCTSYAELDDVKVKISVKKVPSAVADE